MNTYQAQGVHLTGSINLPDAEAVFTALPTLLPNRLRRIPDGETGKRDYFVWWQSELFASVPELVPQFSFYGSEGPQPDIPQDKILEVVGRLPELKPKYDDFALESYALFKKEKANGTIPEETKFQVSLPGVINVMAFVALPFRQAVEPIYEAALGKCLRRIQESIPHDELAVQIDVAMEIALIEGCYTMVSPYFHPTFEGVIDRLSRFANEYVPKDVELGLHLCYGDAEHRHFVEPEDLGNLVKVANALRKQIERPIQWVHMPVPRSRTDAAYYAPLKDLEWDVPELILGLVHPFDEEGTRERMAAAREFVDDFSVATECGMGRTPKEEFEPILDVLRNVSRPVV